MADGDNLILGRVNDATSETTLNSAVVDTSRSALFVINDNGQAIQGTGGASFPGVSGFSERGDGVRATSTDGNGLSARSTNSVAIFAESVNRGGVLGIGHKEPGVSGTSDSNDGVRATSANGNGLSARSTSSVAIFAESADSTGVLGIGHKEPGVSGTSDSNDGVRATSTTGNGLSARSRSSVAIFAESVSGDGVFGVSNAGGKSGVVGINNAHFDNANGVFGQCSSIAGNAIHGVGGTNAGLFDGHVQINGGLDVTGELTCPSKHFCIDHPCDPANKYLLHCSVEAPERINVYSGNVITDEVGTATVLLPNYFETLNRDFRYQLTVIGQFAQAIIAEEIVNNRFVIKTDKPNVKISWQVSGVRKDVYAEANPVVVEKEKSAAERGFYLHPRLFGQPACNALSRSEFDRTMMSGRLDKLDRKASMLER
jgi:hypothetical protein